MWSTRNIESRQEMILSMVEAADEILKKKIRKRVSEEGEWTRIECAWMNEEIRESIKKRRNINRKKRKCKNPIEKEELENEYQLQTEVVQKMIREAKEKYEMELTNEVMEDKGNETVWKNISKKLLMGKSTKGRQR